MIMKNNFKGLKENLKLIIKFYIFKNNSILLLSIINIFILLEIYFLVNFHFFNF